MPLNELSRKHLKPARASDASEIREDDNPSESGDEVQTNVVLMGQGEPLLNFDNVMCALEILLDEDGVGLSPKRVTLSTSGIVPGIERLAKEPLPKTAISLNASNDNKTRPLDAYQSQIPAETVDGSVPQLSSTLLGAPHLEYVMLGGVNDSAEDARREVLAPLKNKKVNLIP